MLKYIWSLTIIYLTIFNKNTNNTITSNITAFNANTTSTITTTITDDNDASFAGEDDHNFYSSDLWVRRWLVRPIFALNCLEQCGQGYAKVEEAVLTLILRRWRFCSCSSPRLVSKLNTPVERGLRQKVRSRAISSQVSGSMLQYFREAFSVSFYRFLWPPRERLPSTSSPKSNRFGSRSSGILSTCPVHLSWKRLRNAWILSILAFWSTSVSGTLSCQRMRSNFRRHRMWKEFSCLAWRLYTVHVSHTYSNVGRMIAWYTFSLVKRLIPLLSHTFYLSVPKAEMALAIL